MYVYVHWYDMDYIVSMIRQLRYFSYQLCLYINTDHQGSTQATLCQSRVSVPLISRLMTSSSRGGTTSKSKESDSFHLEAHVSYILRHSLLQVVFIAYISPKNSSTINNVTMWSTPLVWQFLWQTKG